MTTTDPEGVITILFYDFEVTAYDWMTVMIDPFKPEVITLVNDPEGLCKVYDEHQKDIWVGYNNKHYDQYVMKGIMLGLDPKKINDWIIVDGKEGWQYSDAFRDIPMINYDVMPNPPVGLKTLEGFMGSDIRETETPFDIDRPLTREEIDGMLYYCQHDVEETIKVFMEKIDDFHAMKGIIDAFPHQVDLRNIGDSSARITAKVLGCQKTDRTDEFDWFYLPCLQIQKYRQVVDWFEEQRQYIHDKLQETEKQHQALIINDFYKRKLTVDVAGIPHTFGFGGLHGAADHPVHYKGQILHVDVNNYYPSILIAWDLVTRSATNDNYAEVYKTRKQLKLKQQAAKTKEERSQWKKAQLPYKKMLNALSGAMKDKTNPAYDPRNNNVMCINGQLMLLDLIEHLEVIPGFQLIQSNTDGLIIWVPDTQESFDLVDDICYDWESRCSTEKCEVLLALDRISEIWQKDVNNYLWKGPDGSVERIGAYVKGLSRIDNDLPIINKAMVDYMVSGTPVEQTIMECDELLQFQKVVKLSSKYHHVEHEHCEPVKVFKGRRTYTEYPTTVTYSYKSYRVFASLDPMDGRLLKVKVGKKGEKFGNTPDHCWIDNSDMTGKTVPEKLDRGWYVEQAKKRLKDFGVTV